MLRAVRFFRSQFRRLVDSIDERDGYDNLRKWYAYIRYYTPIAFPEDLPDDKFQEVCEGLRFVRNELARNSKSPLEL